MNKLWSLDEIGRYVSYADRQVRKLVSQPDFPSPVRLFNGAHPRWIAREVIKWKAGREESGRGLIEEGSRYTAVYRHFNKDGALLYVGVSLRAIQRLAEHRRYSGWYRQITRVEIEWFESREEALRAEELAIRNERPLHNINPGTKH